MATSTRAQSISTRSRRAAGAFESPPSYQHEKWRVGTPVVPALHFYAGDVARTNVLALEGEAPSGAYNIGTGVETSVNQLYEYLRKISGRGLPKHGTAKPGEQSRSSINPSKATKVLGWRPETELAAGLAQTLAFFGAVDAPVA